jgi:prepilin-type N-terminal cleavage/methylation domain-containing protein
MLKSLKKRMKDQAGLTLIELLVVIVILGIIAAVAIPMVMGQREAAETNTDAQNLAIVQDAANRYHAVEGKWPAMTDTALAGYLNEIPKKCADGDTATFAINAGKVTLSCATPTKTN